MNLQYIFMKKKYLQMIENNYYDGINGNAILYIIEEIKNLQMI